MFSYIGSLFTPPAHKPSRASAGQAAEAADAPTAPAEAIDSTPATAWLPNTRATPGAAPSEGIGAAGLTMVSRGTFARVDQLLSWLNTHGIATAKWGTGKAKSAKHLWNEIDKKETTLHLMHGSVVRRLSVVKVVVRQPGRMKQYLVCYGQVMDDGRVRDRNQLPS